LCTGLRVPGEEGRSLREALALELGGGVHADHQLFVDAALERLERRPCTGRALGQVGSIEEHGVVAREVGTVVVQDAQAVARDLGVGRVHVHDVDAACRQRLVREAVVQAARLLRQPVEALQSGPTVRASDEFLRQAELQLRIARQVRQRVNSQLLGAIFPHRERISVIETERHARDQPLRRQGPVQLVQPPAAAQPDHLGGNGAGVFRINVDGTGLQRRDDDAGIAEARLQLAAARTGQDLAEDIGLGEALRADSHRVLRLRRADAGEEEDQRLHRA